MVWALTRPGRTLCRVLSRNLLITLGNMLDAEDEDRGTDGRRLGTGQTGTWARKYNGSGGGTLGQGDNVYPAFLPSQRDTHLLGRLVFTLHRMISQPSLLNMGRPVSSSCRSRLVAVMFRTTVISMFLPMKLEERASGHHGHLCHRGH